MSETDCSTTRRYCVDCGAELFKKPGPGRWPVYCDDCRVTRHASAVRKYVVRVGGLECAPERGPCPHCGGRCLDCGAPLPPLDRTGCKHLCVDCLALRSAIRREICLDITPRYCACGAEIIRLSGRGRWPARCIDCAIVKHTPQPRVVKPKTCAWCEQPNPRYTSSIYCSDGCRDAVRLGYMYRRRVGTTKLCKRCGRDRGTRRVYCDNCADIVLKEKQHNKDVARKRGPHRNAEVESVKDAFRALGCDVCGLVAVRCTDLHHQDPTQKKHNIASIWHMDVLLEELPKCAPLCKNHHHLLGIVAHNGGKGLPYYKQVAMVRAEFPETL